MVIERLGTGEPGLPFACRPGRQAHHTGQLGRSALLMLVAFGIGVLPVASAQELLATNAQKKKDGQEPTLRLPDRATGNNLHPITVSATATQQFMVDLDSVSVEPGNLVRYLMVAISPSGARNVSFEGIRCHPLEKRIYAYGREDGTWAPATEDEWKPIGRGPIDRRHAALASDYFCRTDGSPRPLQEIRWAIRTDSSSAPRGS